MELLEREDALMRMRLLLSRVEDAGGSLLMIGGEAGIGKSALVQQFCREIGRTARVLIGACDPLSTPRPLGPLHDIAKSAGGELAAALDALQDRALLFGTVLNALSPAGKPVVAMIEDAHWADEATLDLLRYLGRRIERTHALVLVTYRDDEVGPKHPLRLVLGDLATASAVSRMTLLPLSPGAVAKLASGTDHDANELHRLTGGNPFFVTEVLAAGEGLPASVRDAVLSRAARLSDNARATLDAAAVIGPPIGPELLARVALTTLTEIDECLNAGVLIPDGAGLAFRHELGREAVLRAISSPRRVDLHRRILLALTEQPDDQRELTRISHHAEEAGDRDAVLRYAPLAAERAAALGAHREAAAQYGRALKFADGLPDEQRIELLRGRYRECWTSGQFRESGKALEELSDIARRSGDRLRQAEWLARMTGTYVMEGRNLEAEQASRNAHAILEELPESPIHLLHLRMSATLRMLNRDTAEAVALGNRAIEMARRQGNTENLIAALNSVGSALLIGGDEDEGRTRLLQALDIAISNGAHYQEMLADGNLGSAYGEIYRFELAEQHLRRSIACSEQHDFGAHYSQSWLALVHCYRGRWTEASELALTVLRHPGAPGIARIMALLAIGRVRARRGDPEAGSALDEALTLAGPTATLQRLGPVHAARAEAAWLAGDAERAAAEARGAYDLAVAHRHAWFTGELAYWLWKAGALETTPDHLAEPFGRQIEGDWATAARLWDELGCPYEAARARAESDDSTELAGALSAFERLGAHPAAATTARRLRELGVRPATRGLRQTTRTHPAQLTVREAECLRLIADGCRNAEIAERLFLAPKTVERHIGSLFAKLEVRSRTEAILAARQRGLLD